ncbi:hypothetical protein, partial [Corynebacterium matruchotii]
TGFDLKFNEARDLFLGSHDVTYFLDNRPRIMAIPQPVRMPAPRKPPGNNDRKRMTFTNMHTQSNIL